MAKREIANYIDDFVQDRMDDIMTGLRQLVQDELEAYIDEIVFTVDVDMALEKLADELRKNG